MRVHGGWYGVAPESRQGSGGKAAAEGKAEEEAAAEAKAKAEAEAKAAAKAKAKAEAKAKAAQRRERVIRALRAAEWRPVLLAALGLGLSQLAVGGVLAAAVTGLDSTMGGWLGTWRIVIKPEA